ncbi:NAD-dependent DNA ligase LigA [Marinitoga sp. 38H-ov]|uniref:NAD-dependent DNA ligase LigA n=1 Tax=Marinitoga sp. 38H-ov TaxID=1755814 RepID=UPI0013EBA192|nr:NAD-dependent DNA ligase LigA [Marinitoga sp. 38H-ov]KAF2955321.1 aromatic ring-opening dioxygenase LigA [Marinitoga sp. 38H-ov]
MIPENIKKEYVELKKVIEKYNYYYYVLNNPLISDSDYDKLFNKLIKLEEKFPGLKTPDSPSYRVGGKIINEFKTVQHTTPMLSLDNTYNEEEIIEFINKINKSLNRNNIEYTCELKIDGISISLRYEDGLLTQAITRGNGISGDDVTDNVKTIRSVPLKLNKNINIEVRGEIFMPKKEFLKINEIREDEGLPIFANPRNSTAGTIKLLDTTEVSKRHLDSFIYYILSPENYNLKTQYEALCFLKELGFKINPHTKKVASVEEIIDYWKYWIDNKGKLEYDVDGVVVKINNFEDQRILGNTSRSPRWAIAFKFPAEQAVTKIKDVIFQVGSTGIITPVAIFEPVFLDGSTVQRASLHNFDYIKERDIRINDYVKIEKAGGIIPQIVTVLTEKRNGNEVIIEEPKECPVCGGKVGKINHSEVAIRCLNPLCKAKLKRSLEVWVSRDAMNIQGLGPKLIDRIVEANLIEKISDLYNLDHFKLATLGHGIGPKMISKILKQIEDSKQSGLDKVLYALGIPNVGKKIAKDLAKKFNNIDNLMKAEYDELISIDGIGADIAQSIYDFFRNEYAINIINELKKYGVKLYYESRENDGIFKDMQICVTGELKKMTRGQFKELIEINGGIFKDSVTKKLNLLVVGNNAGSKLEKAKKLGIQILTEDEFFDRYKL